MRTRWLAVLFLVPLIGCKESSPSPTGTAQVASAQPSTAPATSTSAGTANALNSDELSAGKAAPDFSAKAHDGTDIKISELKGKNVVLYFYPKDETPGCTKEACSFRDAWKDLEATKVVMVGISTDSLDSHKKFAEHHKLPFHLVSDADGAIAKAYGVPNRAGFLGRQTFVIGPDGKLKKVYRDVDVTKHAAEVLADVKS